MFAPVIFTPVKDHDLVFELFENIALGGEEIPYNPLNCVLALKNPV